MRQHMEHRHCMQQKQQQYYWQPYITSVNDAIEITDNDKQEENTATALPHM
jgi:hypothetical protein